MIGDLRTLAKFYRRHLRVQPVRELMAVLGIASGVALLFAVQVSHRSLSGSFEEITRGVAGNATLELASRGPEGFSGHVAEEVEHLADVKAAAPILEQPIIAIGPKDRRALTLLGATEQVVSLGGNIARQFQQTGGTSHLGLLVLTAATARTIGARPGSNVTILVAGRIQHVALAATVPADKLGGVAESPIAAAPLAVVQTLAGLPGRVTRILIEPRRGREQALRRTLTGRFGTLLNVRPIDTEARLLRNATGPEKQITLLFSAISLVAGMILAYNALLLASAVRRRFIASLIEMGTDDSMIVASLVFDACVLGVLGSAVGLIAGDVISLFAYREVPGYIAAAFAVGGQRIVGVQTVVIAFAGGMLAAFVAASLPALALLRSSALAEPESGGRTLSLARNLRLSDRLVLAVGVLLVTVSVVMSVVAPGTTVVAIVGLAGGLVLCLPMIARYLLKLASRAARRSDHPAARLSVAELRRSPTRSVALLATGTIAAFLMVLIGGSVADVQHAARTGASDLLSSAQVWLKPGGPENVYTTEPIRYTATQHRLEALPEVSSVLPWRDSFLDIQGRRVWVLGAPPQLPAQIAASQLVEGSLALADRHIREGGWVAISQTIAREDHLRLGQSFSLPTPSGIARFRLAATIANYGWLSGAIVMSGTDHENLWRSKAATELAVTLRPGVSIDHARRAINAALPKGTVLAIQTDEERRSEVSAVLGSTLSRLNDITIVVLIATLASVIALMIAAIWQRQARIDDLSSIGMSTGQFARLIFYESGTVLLCGCIVGIAAGLGAQYLIDGWLHQTTGASVHFAPAWFIGLRTLVFAGGISALATFIAVLQTVEFHPRRTPSVE